MRQAEVRKLCALLEQHPLEHTSTLQGMKPDVEAAIGGHIALFLNGLTETSSIFYITLCGF
jgi:hypothetical protein